MRGVQEEILPEEIAFRVTMAASVLLTISGGFAFFIGVIATSVVLPFRLSISIAASILLSYVGNLVFRRLVIQAKKFGDQARESGDTVSRRGTRDITVVIVFLVLSVTGFAVLYALQMSGFRSESMPKDPLLIVLFHSSAPLLNKLYVIIVGFLTLSSSTIFLSSLIGAVCRVKYLLTPSNRCPSCGKNLSPEFKCCPYCCETNIGTLYSWLEWYKQKIRSLRSSKEETEESEVEWTIPLDEENIND